MADLTLDLWAPLTHKLPLKPRGGSLLAPSWVPDTDQRRLTAYKVLAAYRANCARWHLDADPNTQDKRREYGDAELLVSRVVAGVLGDTVQLVVDGADARLPDEPDLPDPPGDLPAGASDLDRRVHAARLARWETQAAAIVDEWEAAWAAQPALQARQDWLRAWADLEFVAGKIHEAEGDAVGLGDGVYVLAWSAEKQRPTLDVYDPGFYFPVIDDTGSYPTKVHLAWEFDVDGVTFVRRLTWELAPIPPTVTADGTATAGPGERVNPATGRVERRYPWAPDEWTPTTCLYTDATWRFDQLGAGAHVDDLDPARAAHALTSDGRPADRLDLRIDFVPVVHVPNTPSTREHFGASILLVVAQLLDDLHASDTDIQDGAALAAGPVIALAGGTTGDGTTVRPGIVWNIPDGGRMDVLDLAAGLAQLSQLNDRLLSRLSVNGRVPAEVLGRVDASQVPSGVALALAFGPFRQLVDELRLVRKPKYQLLLKMVQRVAQAGQVLDPGPTPPAHLALGAYLPADLKAAADLVVALLAAHGLSRQTALAFLVDAGLSINDAGLELDRIAGEDTRSALEVAEATGSEELAAERLGVDLPAVASPPGPPVITLPAPPGGG